jgi:aryl-alcohol dehydrogenase-like predicted oxidoreductase
MNRETVKCDTIPLPISRVGLGTWAIGGWMWGGSDESESIKTIQHALEIGINLIDTAPVYGFGHSEEIVGKALTDGGRRDKAVLATKVALEWGDGKVYRNATPKRIREEKPIDWVSTPGRITGRAFLHSPSVGFSTEVKL